MEDCHPKEAVLGRLNTLIETASTAFPDTLDDSEKLTAWLYLQKAARAADEARQPKCAGSQWPNSHEPNECRHRTTSDPTSQHEDDGTDSHLPQLEKDGSAHHSFKHSCRGCPRSVATSGEDLNIQRPTNVSHDGLYHLDECAGQCLCTARLHHQCAKGQREPHTGGNLSSVWSILGPPSLSTQKSAALLKPPVASTRAFMSSSGDADPGVTTEPRGLRETQSIPADLFTTTAVSGRSAALDVCGASSNPASARGDAAQKAFERNTSHYRRQNPRPACPRDRALSPSLDSRRSTTPGSHTKPCSTQQTSRRAATGNKCQRRPSNTGGNIKSKLPSSSAEQL